ncbi:hypothetical protein M7I_5247 [Glarea lozoyensis 74030]|uniref:Formamidopyrimidine-DNA glycosylase catalytic domain-containing protein n=1 Tax=Glarea lozoyensis (strain ATCC 74030 / MF5533) TaxID=1104152 RepID=H0ERC8_GLAL7|nr:hypothetical protein M7I_5247 [Glarea lozoyensis 74030]
MPEIAEIARAVHNLKRTIVGKTLAKVTAVDDANIFGKTEWLRCRGRPRVAA